MDSWQIAFSLGQTVGTLAAVMWIVKSLRSDLDKSKEDYYKKMEEVNEKHYKLREEMAGSYLRRDEWLSHHNKLEAKLDKKLDEIKELIREVRYERDAK